MNSFVILGIMGGILAVDHRAGWQSLLAQPVFSAAAVGLIIGEIEVALAVGVVLELVYLSIVPMRGARIPDQIAAGVVGAGTAVLLVQNTGDPRFVFIGAIGVFMGLLAGEAGVRLTAPFFVVQNRMLSGFEFAPDADGKTTVHRIFWVHAGSIAFIFVVEALLVLLLGVCGYFAGDRLTRVTDGLLVEGASRWIVLVPAIGAASLIHLFWQHHLRRALLVCALMVVIFLWLT